MCECPSIRPGISVAPGRSTTVSPTATSFDAISSLLSAGIYMIIALAALAQAPHDPRVRAFVGVAAAGVAPYCVTAQIWAFGTGPTFTKGTIVVLALSLMLGSL